MADATVLNAHPCAVRTFRDVRVPKLLLPGRNIKKISYDCARQLREHYVPPAYLSLLDEGLWLNCEGGRNMKRNKVK